ncbi:MAG: DsbA family protein [Actinomycetota bacterium]|nr:DsbA family protein [Actinomycetota bacterium]
MDVAPGTIVVWSDIACPWATLAVHRLDAARARLGLDAQVRFDHRAFPLELFNERPTPRKVLAAEVPVVGGCAPEFGWQVWQAPDSHWPVTTLLALEAVQAAKEQSLEASEQLDLALRRAFFAESKCVSMRHVVLDAAAGCEAVDAGVLREALDDGRARRAVIEQRERAEQEGVQGSPHLFLPDGSDAHNPGVRMHWEGEHGKGFPVVDADDPSVYEQLLQRAAG